MALLQAVLPDRVLGREFLDFQASFSFPRSALLSVGSLAPEALPPFFATTSPSDFSTSFGAFSGLPSSAPTSRAGDVEISQVPRLILGSVLPSSIPAGTMRPCHFGYTVAAFDDFYRLGSRDKPISRLNPFTCVAARYLAVYASPRRSPDAAQDSLRPCSAKLWAEDFSFDLLWIDQAYPGAQKCRLASAVER